MKALITIVAAIAAFGAVGVIAAIVYGVRTYGWQWTAIWTGGGVLVGLVLGWLVARFVLPASARYTNTQIMLGGGAITGIVIFLALVWHYAFP